MSHYDLSGLLALKAMRDAAPPPPPVQPEKHKGGARANAGRKAGEATAVVRVPSACLKTVTEIIFNHRYAVTPTSPAADLNPVTEIKDDAAALSAMSALREYFRSEYLMGASDIAFSCWIENTLNSVTGINVSGVQS